jgi:tetratricopeptide (TPR) repeat protein
MEGQKTAVSIALTREGAELLWESFKSDTPDISLVFDMEFAGIREPYEATLEADWSQVSKHNRIKAGVKYKWFGADVDILFQELRQSGAIKITTKGDNAVMDKILQSANEKLLKVMFDPVKADDLTRAASDSGYNSLNQAAKMLRDAAGSRSSSQRGSGSRRSSGSGSRSHNIYDTSKENILAAMLNVLIPSTAYADNDSTSTGQEEALRRFTEGVTLANAERYGEALEAFEAAEAMGIRGTGTDSPSGVVMHNIGMCHYRMGNYAEAEQAFREALNRYPAGHERIENTQQRLEESRRMIEGGDQSGGARASDGTDEHPSGESVDQRATDSSSSDTASGETASEAYSRARRLYEQARTGGFQEEATRAALEAYESYQQNHSPTGSRGEEVSGRIRMLQERLASRGSDTRSESSDTSDSEDLDGLLPNPFEDGASSPSTTTGSGSSTTARPETTTTTSRPESSTAGTGRSGSSASETRQPASASGSSEATPSRQATPSRRSRSDGSPGFSLVASYQMKRIKRSGKMVYNMNHYRTENQAFAMAENIGDIYKRYGNDDRVFRAVTIDDPVFKQREIMVTLDGQDTETFTKYLNFVTVKMRKKHQNGDVSTGEIVITPERFNESGNNFTMMYGWKGDSNRVAWLNYEYEAIWSFHGGVEIRSPWTQTDSPMLSLNPPHRYRSISIEGDGETLSDAGVRHGVVTFNCRIGDEFVSRQATIRNDSSVPALIIDVPEDNESPETTVGITWYLKRGRQVSTEEFTLESDIVYWDELPEGDA